MKSNPYRADVPYKPWYAVDYYYGHRMIHGRYWFRWQARLAAVGVLAVEHVPETP